MRSRMDVKTTGETESTVKERAKTQKKRLPLMFKRKVESFVTSQLKKRVKFNESI